MADDEPCITDDVLVTLRNEAEATDVSILRRMVGLPVRGRTGVRIDRVLEARGLRRVISAVRPRVA